MPEWVLLVVVVCAAIQSTFGMDILVFGTPTLLLMGLGFTETLSYLLPASIALSIIQVRGGGRPGRGISRDLWYFCVPAIAGGLLFTIFGATELPIRRIIGVVMILSVASIAFRPSREMLRIAVLRHSRPYHAVMGFICPTQ